MPADDGLAGLLVRVGAERRVLGRRASAAPTPSLSMSALVFGSIAIEMTGSGKIIFSRTIGCFSSQSVSPVRVSRRPTAA